MNFSLCQRLEAVSHLVRPGAVLADVGTDHALLPICLLKEGKIQRAVASDIADGPIMKAEENIRSAGYSGRITAQKADGLTGIEKHNPTDITICGMGGETIRDIISASVYIKNPTVRLVLQPQSFASLLREYLLAEGFNIVDEVICFDRGKFYVAMAAEYDGIVRRCSEVELMLGKINIERGGEMLARYIEHKKEVLKVKTDGMKNAGLDTKSEEALMSELERIESDNSRKEQST